MGNEVAVSANPNQALTPFTMSEAMRLADTMANGKLVPTHLQKSAADCLMVIEQAMRWRMSPFAVAQATSVIGGKLMYEGKLVAAALNSSGVLAGRLTYDFSGTGANRTVKVSGVIRGEQAARVADVALSDVKTNNAMWTKQPDQQLIYAGTRIWARRHAPEVILGVYTPEEEFTDVGTVVVHPQPSARAREVIEATKPDDSPVRDALMQRLHDAALKGPAALQLAWEGLAKSERTQIGGESLAAFKALAFKHDPDAKDDNAAAE